MATIRIPDEERIISEYEEVRVYLAKAGIDYEHWRGDRLPQGTTQQQILEAYSREIENLKKEGGYITADVIDINPETPGIEEMLAKFNKEHWHDEDEVRFTISGRGIFYIHPANAHVFSIEVGEGDLIRVPRMAYHWFELCEDRSIMAIRLFQNKSGWTPYYTGSGVDGKYQPVCMGPVYFKPH